MTCCCDGSCSFASFSALVILSDQAVVWSSRFVCRGKTKPRKTSKEVLRPKICCNCVEFYEKCTKVIDLLITTTSTSAVGEPCKRKRKIVSLQAEVIFAANRESFISFSMVCNALQPSNHARSPRGGITVLLR